MRKSAKTIYIVSLLLLLGITIYPPVKSKVMRAVWTESGYSIDPQISEQWNTSTNRLLFWDFNYIDYKQQNGKWIELTYQASIGYYRLIAYYIAIIVLTILMLILSSPKLNSGIIEIMKGK